MTRLFSRQQGARLVVPIGALLLVACGGGGGNPRNTTGAGPAPVEVGSPTSPTEPASFMVLAKAGITNVTGSTITGGNLGLSPAAATYLTGFSLVADSSNTFATSSSLVAPARVYAANYADPTPADLTSAVLRMETAYVDAAGRSPPDFLNLGSGNLGGLTLAPGLYTWGSTVTVPTSVTLSGGTSDVWILQVSGDLDVAPAVNVVLAGGAQARNIYWQVAGQATIHAGAHFEGIILSHTAITLQTAASLHGRALAQTQVALDNNVLAAP